MSETVLRRYVLPSLKLEGWAIIVIGDDGFFATVSDFGNYAYKWGSMGCPVREFLARMGDDPDYFMSKLAQGRRDYYGDETEKKIRKRIIAARRERLLSTEAARRESDLLKEIDLYHREGFAQWVNASDLDDYGERATMAHYDYTADLRGFGKHIMPRFAAILRAELAAEGVAVRDAPVREAPRKLGPWTATRADSFRRDGDPSAYVYRYVVASSFKPQPEGPPKALRRWYCPKTNTEHDDVLEAMRACDAALERDGCLV